jgi:hypothetical protein
MLIDRYLIVRTLLAAEGTMNEGFNSTRFGLRGFPRLQKGMVSRDIILAEFTGCTLPMYCRFCKTDQDAKQGVKVTAGGASHFTLTDLAVDAMIQLQSKSSQEDMVVLPSRKLFTALIATDHAPILLRKDQ